MPKNDPFNDFDDEDEDDYLTFEESDEGGVRQGPIIIAAVLLLLAVFAAIAFVYLKGDADTETPQIAAQTEEFKETPMADSINSVDGTSADVYNSAEGTPPPALEVQATGTAEDPLVAANQVAPPVAKTVAPVVTAPRPATVAKPVTTVAATPKPVVTAPVATKPTPKPEVKIASATPTAAPKPVAAKPAPVVTATPATSSTGHSAQLGSFTSRASAEQALANYKADGLTGPVSIVAADLGAKGTWYRIRATGFNSRDQALSFCAKAKSAGANCIPAN